MNLSQTYADDQRCHLRKVCAQSYESSRRKILCWLCVLCANLHMIDKFFNLVLKKLAAA